MTAENVRAMPGSVPRNGMPPSGGYVYRGTGEDSLTGHLSLRPEPVSVPRRQVSLAVCPSCEADLCHTCFGDGCCCGCNDAPPVAAEPERCGTCGYLKTARGHKLACGDPDSARINRLADSIGAALWAARSAPGHSSR